MDYPLGDVGQGLLDRSVYLSSAPHMTIPVPWQHAGWAVPQPSSGEGPDDPPQDTFYGSVS